MSMEGLIMRCY